MCNVRIPGLHLCPAPEASVSAIPEGQEVTSQSRKHRGYNTQKVFAEYMRDIFPYAEPTGAGRQGRDILSTPGVWFELKARTGFNPLAALKQIEGELSEEENAKWADGLKQMSSGDVPEFDKGVAVLRMNGQGPGTIGEWVVCMRVDTLKELLKEAGYAPE